MAVLGYENSEHTFVRLTCPDNAESGIFENRGCPGSYFFLDLKNETGKKMIETYTNIKKKTKTFLLALSIGGG